MAYKSIWKVFGSLVIDFWCAKRNFLLGQGTGNKGDQGVEAEGRLNQINFFWGGVKEYISLNIRHFLCLN